MFLKPKNTALNPKALLYKRYIGLNASKSTKNVYKTISDTQVMQFWVFNNMTLAFEEVEAKTNSINVSVTDIFGYGDKSFRFDGTKWVSADKVPENALPLKYANISNKYQVNDYYYAGSFDYMIKGGIEGSSTQPIKGTVLQLDALNITYYNDNITIDRDDLVVLSNRLFVVEDTEVVQKRMPKVYNVYSATLNNII